MRTLLFSIIFAVAALDARAATYLLLSQTNSFAAGITNAAKAYTDSHGGSAPVGTVVASGTPQIGDLLTSQDGTRTNAVWQARGYWKPKFITNNYSILTNDTYLAVMGAWTNTLPPANSIPAGRFFIVKANSTNGATVFPSGADTIDLTLTNDSLPFPTSHNYMSDGTNNWMRW